MYELLCNLYVKAYSAAVFLRRQRTYFFPFHIAGFALTTDIYSIMSQQRHKLKWFDRRATQPQLNWHTAKHGYIVQNCFINLSAENKFKVHTWLIWRIQWTFFKGMIFQRNNDLLFPFRKYFFFCTFITSFSKICREVLNWQMWRYKSHPALYSSGAIGTWCFETELFILLIIQSVASHSFLCDCLTLLTGHCFV